MNIKSTYVECWDWVHTWTCTCVHNTAGPRPSQAGTCLHVCGWARDWSLTRALVTGCLSELWQSLWVDWDVRPHWYLTEHWCWHQWPASPAASHQPPAAVLSATHQPLSLSVYVSVTLRTGMRQPLTRVSGHSSSSVQLYSCTVVHTPSTTPQCVQPQSVRGRVSGRRHQAATDYSSWISETILNISHTPILYWTNCSTSANLNNRSQHSTTYAHLNIFSSLLCLLGCQGRLQKKNSKKSDIVTKGR